MHFHSWTVLVAPSLDIVVFHILILTTLAKVFFTTSIHFNVSDDQWYIYISGQNIADCVLKSVQLPQPSYGSTNHVKQNVM